MKKPYAIAIVGNSGAGKTTLLERLIPALKRKGLRVGVDKHDAHRFEYDADPRIQVIGDASQGSA